jgi:hypothetical protein
MTSAAAVSRLKSKKISKAWAPPNGIRNALTHISEIVLNQADPLAKEMCTGLTALLAQEQIAITLGEI